MDLVRQIQAYEPFNEQEACDKRRILAFLEANENPFSRANEMAHMTASAWIVNKARNQVLMCYHKIYDSWSWLGGHADGEEDLLKTALKEAKEESGLQDLKPVSTDIYSLEILTVDGHEKNGKYISSHLHMNVTYLLEASEHALLTVKPDENTGLKWFTLKEALEASTEPWFVERIYSKLNEKLKMKS